MTSYARITDNLYLGSYTDAIDFADDFDIIINVAKECTNKSDYFYSYLDSPSEKICESFDDLSDIIQLYVAQNKKVLVHCFAGKSRSASFVIIYLIKYMNYNLNDAYKYVDSLRDIYPNLGFIEQMMDYEKKINHIENSTLNYDDIVIENIYNTFFISKEIIKDIYYVKNKNVQETINHIITL
jgi:protein-tyrosine phosphatase